MDTHVIPTHDLVAHAPTRQCLCRPHVREQSYATAIVVHHAYDAREYFEDDRDPEDDECPS